MKKKTSKEKSLQDKWKEFSISFLDSLSRALVLIVIFGFFSYLFFKLFPSFPKQFSLLFLVIIGILASPYFSKVSPFKYLFKKYEKWLFKTFKI